ncbi:MAG: hypothetical protein SH848_11320 [Saprospiraceae bacterium]|nr:hypothetical protein [Saprospiraceae bacterium]MDZ4704512.1 hypothetical protein [Saprospiraceae bacterium]
MDIRLLQSKDIDKTKWNSCVHFAPNGNVFGYKWYLDQVAKDWIGLVEGDYESVFPLVWRYRRGLWGHKELHQPHWMREMGIYSVHALSPARIQQFLERIPPEFRHIKIAVSGKNALPKDLPFTSTPQTNFQLSLNNTYETLTGCYTSDLFRQMDKATTAKLMLTANLKPEKIADFYEKYAKDRRDLETRYHALLRVMYNALHRGWGFTSAVLDADGNPCAANFFIYSHGKLLSLAPVASKTGEAVGALSFMFDLTVRIHAERPLALDFNGYEHASDFGAQPAPYFQISRVKKKGFF